MKLDFEQELFCLAQDWANKRMGLMTTTGTPWPIEKKIQERADNLRDCYLDFYKAAESLKLQMELNSFNALLKSYGIEPALTLDQYFKIKDKDAQR